MANKRLSKLSKLKSSELEPDEQSLADEDGHAFSLSGVLSLATEENMNCLYTNGKGMLY
jgi:hypothetical protein